jgi:ABC-type branched-subunit amino acid transport system ATPase component
MTIVASLFGLSTETEDLEQVITTHAYVLENGRVVMEGKGSDLLNNDHVKKAYLAI